MQGCWCASEAWYDSRRKRVVGFRGLGVVRGVDDRNKGLCP